MADVTERMLALLSTLQTGRSFGAAELTARLGVSARTLRRDVDRLRGYGYPVDARPGPGGHYRLAAGRTMPPLVLDDDEAVAALLALALLAATTPATDGALDDAATRAYGKLDQFLPARLRPRAVSIRASLETSPRRTPAVTAEQLGTVAEAIARRETLAFTYTTTKGVRARRRVEPYRQVHHLLRWYLLGWDLDRADWRVFRTDRVSGAVSTGTRFAPRQLPARTALDYLRQGLNKGRRRVELVVDAPATRVADALRHQDAEITPLDGDRTAVTVALDGWQWLLPQLAYLDADFTVTAPVELAAGWRVFARRLLAASETADPGGTQA